MQNQVEIIVSWRKVRQIPPSLHCAIIARGGANYLRKSFVEGIIVATFDAQIIKDNIKL